MGLTMVSTDRQKDWNPCAVSNGGCSHLCFFTKSNYTCGCPDEAKGCTTTPKTWISLECPPSITVCPTEEDDEVPEYSDPLLPDNGPSERDSNVSSHFYVMTLVPMLCIILLSIVLVVVLLIRRGKKKYLYPTGRSFSNPNYYSSSGEPNGTHNNTDRKQFIWKRLKYDKSQVSLMRYICVTEMRPTETNLTLEIQFVESLSPYYIFTFMYMYLHESHVFRKGCMKNV